MSQILTLTLLPEAGARLKGAMKLLCNNTSVSVKHVHINEQQCAEKKMRKNHTVIFFKSS